jgi:hypothetical protein
MDIAMKNDRIKSVYANISSAKGTFLKASRFENKRHD